MGLHLGDSLEILKTFEDNSIDAVVTDPPYGLAFMGKHWDYDVPTVWLWKEVFRVLKPGGHLLSFGGTRTYHRMVVNIEDAGFEIRDQIQWIYGSGFPKSQNIAIAIDKKLGAMSHRGSALNLAGAGNRKDIKTGEGIGSQGAPTHEPITSEAKQWNGFGTALKPANEPIVLARKPISEKTVAANVLKWGTGGLNIDGCRVEGEYKNQGGGSFATGKFANSNRSNTDKNGLLKIEETKTQGRFPANLILDEVAAAMLDEQSGVLKSAGEYKGDKNSDPRKSIFGVGKTKDKNAYAGQIGGASRFFYCAKTSKSERNAGLEGMPLVNSGMMEDDNYDIKTGSGNSRDTKNQNFHPTVKPIRLMSYLCRLITPPGGTILDPFMGSGSTGVAARKEGFEFIGIEKELEYFEIAQRRINRA